jgi:hypothetical protein
MDEIPDHVDLVHPVQYLPGACYASQCLRMPVLEQFKHSRIPSDPVLWEIFGPVRGCEKNASGVPERSPGLRRYPGKKIYPPTNPNPEGLHKIWNPFRVLVGKGRAGCPRVASRPWAVIGNRVAVHRGIPLMRLRVKLNCSSRRRNHKPILPRNSRE